MIRALALALWLLAVVAGVILFGLLTNWFRYGLSLEATVVAMTTALAVLVVGGVSFLSYIRNSISFLVLNKVIVLIAVGFILHVHEEAFGELPHFYIAHNEKSPTTVLQTQQGSCKYWIEIQNPFSTYHEEFMVFDCGNEKRIPIQVFAGPANAYFSATKADDWGTLALTSDANVMILTLGPLLSPSRDKFQVDIKNSTAIKLPSS